jgi:hypothetical protein
MRAHGGLWWSPRRLPIFLKEPPRRGAGRILGFHPIVGPTGPIRGAKPLWHDADKVIAVVGEHQSSSVLAGIEVAHRYHVPYVNTNGFADPIREKGYVEVFSPAGFNTWLAIGTGSTMKALGA